MTAAAKLVVVVAVFVVAVFAGTDHPRYEAIDKHTQSMYTADWTAVHNSWIGIDNNLEACDHPTQKTSYPLCADGFVVRESGVDAELLSDHVCPAVQCLQRSLLSHTCAISPSDSIDYLPPVATTSLDNSTICPLPSYFESGDPYVSEKSFGMDLGIAPAYLPIVPVRLSINGTVSAFSLEGECIPISNAEITAWQVNPAALTPFTVTGQFRHALDAAAALERAGVSGEVTTHAPQTDLVSPREQSLRQKSCRATQHTTEAGAYSFDTLVPPSYGPPRHIMFQVAAPGYETLTTRMYFDQDWRLHQLTTLRGEVHPDPIGLNADVSYWRDKFSATPVNKDPRVAKLHFRPTATSTKAGQVSGMFETEFDFVLRPTRLPLVEPTTATAADGALHSLAARASGGDRSGVPPVDLNGLWADAQGALLRVETHGPSLLVHEHPHPRTWGAAIGMVTGNSIRGVDFHQVLSSEDLSNAAKQRDNPKVDFNPSLTTWSAAGISTGTITPADPFATAPFSAQSPQAVSIQWSGGGFEDIWTKQPENPESLPGYRFLKLLVSRETGGVPGGSLLLNEIEFFQGILAQDQRPQEGFKMRNPRNPSPQVVTCSTFLTQDNHCYKAFDGDASASSAWVTNPVGSRRHALSEPQWVTFDFGEGRAASPTALRIVCDAKNAATRALGCPMSFTLQGSHDNVKFDVLYTQDLFDYDREYGPEGVKFLFIYDTVKGRVNGQRCGSCSSGPGFTCSVDSYDATCNSRYCGQDALCTPEPQCPAGEYMHYGFQGYARPAFFCKQCAAGRFGSAAGLKSPACSGLCQEGHFCPAGSTSDAQFPCGGAHLYCPEGSPRPIPAAAGRYTVSRADITANTTAAYEVSIAVRDVSQRVAEFLCPRGSYCKGGAAVLCPVGRYGNITGLQTADCSGSCGDGTYCPAGSVLPTPCPQGYYCPDGKEPSICPAGTYGSEEGLTGRQCSGYCAAGYYCPAGSVVSTTTKCPAGTYGAVQGLKDSACSGLCAEGYFCPPGSTRHKQSACGDASVFCPVGSALPTTVAKGFYSIGGTSDRTRTSQVPAEAGFFASLGVKFPCSAGTYGAVAGLNADVDNFYSSAPSRAPTSPPTALPSIAPSAPPSCGPTPSPSASPSSPIVSRSPSVKPTALPTFDPTAAPTFNPTEDPSASPTYSPTRNPSFAPSFKPSSKPTSKPTAAGFYYPTSIPSVALLTTLVPTTSPSLPEDLPATAFQCSGVCDYGHYCPRNSIAQIPCPAGRYGASRGLENAQCTATCPLGHYCVAGSRLPVECPAGVFGNNTGLKDATCSTDCWSGGCNPTAQLCEAGYYCPQGSISGTQVQCGDAGVFCPRGSAAPTQVAPGYYSIGRGSSAIHNTADSSDRADTDDTEAHHTRIGQSICEEGHYCVGGIKRNCPPGVFGASKGLQTAACSGLCAAGHYCPEGSVNATTHRCPAGRYGSTAGLKDSSCTGLCNPGYHCPEASTSPTQLECAVLARTGTFDSTIAVAAKALQPVGQPAAADESALRTDVYIGSFNTTTKRLPNTNITVVEVTAANSVFCPQGSALPLTVRPGYYTVGNNRTTRFAQSPCPMGSYCVNGVVEDCPAGRYGRAERLMDSLCTGLCAKGHYCPTGSVSSTQHPCPIGRYGSEEGLGSPSCSGPCVHPLDCPIGTVIARPRSEL